MSTLRMAVSFGDGAPSLEEQSRILDALASALKESLGSDQRLTRMPALQLPGGPQPAAAQQGVPSRVFLLELPDGEPPDGALRALGSWYMRYPDLVVTVKADGPAGGTSLKLQSFSTVAFARAAAQVASLLASDESS